MIARSPGSALTTAATNFRRQDRAFGTDVRNFRYGPLTPVQQRRWQGITRTTPQATVYGDNERGQVRYSGPRPARA